MEKINLFCLPFAGGSKYSYRQYEQNGPPFINIIPLEYPGRGARISEPLLADIHEMSDDLYQQIEHILDQGNYAIYGHSLGGLVACLLTRKVIRKRHRPPLHLFITGTTGPSAPSREKKKRHLMNKKEFFEEIKSLNGLPDGIMDDQELLDYVEPIIRADFQVSETYVYQEEEILDLPITVISGTNEDMKEEDIHLWQKETKHKVDFRQMPGGHFFINKYPGEIIQIIAKKLVVHTKIY